MIKDVHINNPKSVAEADGIPSRFTHGLRERRHFREAVAPWRSPSRVVGDSVLYHSLSALASAEVNFWFTCRRKRLVARPADGCGERCRMTFSATWASAYI